MHGPRALVITAAGINCDLELAESFRAAGAEPECVLLSELLRDPARVDRFQLVGLPGGFSYGDDIAAGRIMGALMRRNLYPALAAAAWGGGLHQRQDAIDAELLYAAFCFGKRGLGLQGAVAGKRLAVSGVSN